MVTWGKVHVGGLREMGLDDVSKAEHSGGDLRSRRLSARRMFGVHGFELNVEGYARDNVC